MFSAYNIFMSLKRILIVDDARDVGRMYQQALRTAHPKVPVAYVPSAEEAMVEVTTFKVDLMVVDIRLPGMSGFELVKRVLARQPGIKVVMITGLDVDADLEAQSRAVGASRLLAKPLSVSAFLSAIEDTLAEINATAAAGDAPAEATRVSTAPLKGAAPEALPVVAVAPPAGPTLSEELSGLRAAFGASAVLLLDDTGRITAQAGDGQAPALVERLASDLMAGLSSMQKIARVIGTPVPNGVQALRGKDHNLIIAPVGRYALVVVLASTSSGLRTAIAFEEALHAQKELARILGEMGLNVLPITSELPKLDDFAAPQISAPVEEDEAVEVPAEELEALADLLGKSGEDAALDADDFWDNLEPGETAQPDSPDVLSYDQARKLGLFPEDEE